MRDERKDPLIMVKPIAEIKVEPGAGDLLDSPAMQPYMNLMIASMQARDTGPALAELAALPLEKRYVLRVASALKGLC
jgi:hypothetical protein